MPTEPTSYEISDADLINKFMHAAARAGASNSGLVIDIMASVYLEDLHYLKGCMLARLAGIKPEIQPGTTVSIPADKTVPGINLQGWSFHVSPLAEGSYTVVRVWYFKEKWYLELFGQKSKEGGIALFPADQFVMSTPKPVAAAA